MTATAAPATAPQIAYATDLRDKLVAQPVHYLDELPEFDALFDPSARLYRLAHTLAEVAGSARRLARANPAERAMIIDGDNTRDAILRRILDRRGELAATTDANLAAMDRDQISAYIDAAKGLA